MAQLRSIEYTTAPLGSIAAIVFVYGLGQVLINLVILIFNLLRAFPSPPREADF